MENRHSLLKSLLRAVDSITGTDKENTAPGSSQQLQEAWCTLKPKGTFNRDSCGCGDRAMDAGRDA